jgi:glycosyltransferase involved in cell wall biosynthesis
MGVLFLTPNWSAPSEVWIARQIQALDGHIVAIGACDPQQRRWGGRIPAIRLASAPPPLWQRLAYRAGLAATPTPRPAADALAAAVAGDAVSVILVHYLDFALRFEQVWKQIDKPLFVHPHGYDTQWNYRRRDPPHEPYFPPEYPAAVRRLSERAILIANSGSVRERLLDIGVPGDRVVLQYYGIPSPAACPVHSDRSRGVQVLYLGRLVDCKGPGLVIQAFERACADGLDGHLTLAGDGPLRGSCEELVRRSPVADRTRMIGAVDAATANRLRAEADVFTAHNCRGPITRQEESFGVAVVEAMAAGLPVVTGRSGGVRETVVDGETGFLVEPGDVDAHAAALLRLAQEPDLRHRMGTAGWRRAREMFDCGRRSAELRRLLGVEMACVAP